MKIVFANVNFGHFGLYFGQSMGKRQTGNEGKEMDMTCNKGPGYNQTKATRVLLVNIENSTPYKDLWICTLDFCTLSCGWLCVCMCG